jgi:glycosyltransferase involved in cell wall biosynthesis
MDTHPEGTPPQVSVIIPARNEEASVGACLASLVAQAGVTYEIIVVDDGSTDRTRHIAQSFPQVKIVDADPLPAGWTGKNNAVVSGARHARANWLLFTDADTVHLPGSLKESFSEVQRQQATLLSYSPEQEVHTFAEKAVMPVIFGELAARFRPRDVSDPYSAAAAANGQYLLISREAYDAVGGHAAVATDLLEDVALARAVKKSGRKIYFRYADDAVRTRMYRHWPQLRDGWTKNLALLFPVPAYLAVQRFLEFLLIVAPLVIAGIELGRGRPGSAAIVGGVYLTMWAAFQTRIRKAHFRWDANLLAIFGLPIFAYLLLRSKRAHQKGRVTWKSRSYPGPSAIGHGLNSGNTPAA